MSARAISILMLAALAASAGCSAGPWAYYSPARAGGAAQRELAGAAGQGVAEFNSGLALAAELRYQEAGEAFARALQAFQSAGDDARAAESLFWVAYCYEKRDRPQEAAIFYKRVLDRYRRTPAARQSELRLDRLPQPGKP